MTSDPPSKLAKAHSVFIRLALPPYTIHFKSPNYTPPHTLELLDKKVCKETLKSTAQDLSVREAIGGDVKFWGEFVVLLKAAVASFERRSFHHQQQEQSHVNGGIDYESTSGSLIANHYPGLWRDLERVNDLVSISRNVLTVGAQAQDLAAEYGLDTALFRLIHCSVRVTARGYDGDAGTGEEEKWQWVINAYKKLLITCLQCLNNLVAQNEKRKIILWVALFDNPSESVVETGMRNPEEDFSDSDDEKEANYNSTRALTARIPLPTTPPEPHLTDADVLYAYGNTLTPTDLSTAASLDKTKPFLPIPELATQARLDPEAAEENAYLYFTHLTAPRIQRAYQNAFARLPTAAEIHLTLPTIWLEELTNAWQNDEAEMWLSYDNRMHAARYEYEEESQKFDKYLSKKARLPVRGKYDPPVKMVQKMEPRCLLAANGTGMPVDHQLGVLSKKLAQRYRPGVSVPPVENVLRTPRARVGGGGGGEEGHVFLAEPLDTNPVGGDEGKMLFTAEAGRVILESGKGELMKRLRPIVPNSNSNLNQAHGLRSGETTKSDGELDRYQAAVTAANVGVASGRRHLSDSAAVVGTGRRRSTNGNVHGAAQMHVQEAFAEDSVDEDEDEDEEEEEEDDEEEEEEEDDEEEEEEEDYPGSTEDGRGLLTDVPLILGPSEIEVLPMLIMSGIVPPHPPLNTSSPPSGVGGDVVANHDDPQTCSISEHQPLLTHLLLSQTSGRNLLRELLIFVAAWDLREEELYFKFMLKIIEAVLKAGLLPFCYHAFRDRSRSKDIISPAQAVVMKLLTTMFRQRSSAGTTTAGATRVDLQVLNFIFTEFRQHIIPQTCALIFLQGQIHKGRAGAEDFPLNLWDMERMYEGVYQFLEFFAVVCEEQPQQTNPQTEAQTDVFSWKKVLAEWEMARELVTLLRELEQGIPKCVVQTLPPLPLSLPSQMVPQQVMSAPQPPPMPMRSLSAGDAATAPPVSVERPFDVVEENEHPLAYPIPEEQAQAQAHQQPDQDEPSDFEWRNLKKLTVLVLSSLIWKNRLVQDQVREAGGLEALVSCCRADEHNPYIREHAIMCLRFAVEGCEGNGRVLRAMAEREDTHHPGGRVGGDGGGGGGVPREVLDMQGFESFLDNRGQVGLRRKGTSTASTGALATGASTADLPLAPTASTYSSAGAYARGLESVLLPQQSQMTTKMTAEKAAELMQNALRDLPLGDRAVTDRQKAEALARLDRAFESTEKALGGTSGASTNMAGAASAKGVNGNGAGGVGSAGGSRADVGGGVVKEKRRH